MTATRTRSRIGALIAAPLLASLAVPSAAQDESGDRQQGRAVEYGTEALGATTERFLQEDGEALYLTVCSGCHQPQGTGAVGAGVYPPLSANPVLEGSRYPAWIIVSGMGAMPSFGDWLNDAQVVAVVDYIQSSFGNDYETNLTEDDVARIREDAP